MFLSLVTVVLWLSVSAEAMKVFVPDRVLTSLANHGACNITVGFAKNDNRSLRDLFSADDQDENALMNHLKHVADESWSNFVEEAPLYGLDPETFRFHVIANAISIDNVSKSAFALIGERDDVIEILSNERMLEESSSSFEPDVNTLNDKQFQFEKSSEEQKANQQQAEEFLPQLTSMQGEKLWDLGFKGQGIVIGVSSTGINIEHEALRDNYRGLQEDDSLDHNYNWYEAFPESRPVPFDRFNVGTHITGTIAGAAESIGVAPKAKYISCKSIDDKQVDTPESIIGCLEFFLAPFDLNGKNPKPKKRPHVIVTPNCYSCEAQSTLLQSSIDALMAAGVMVITSSGFVRQLDLDLSIECGKVNRPPAIYPEVLTLGAVTETLERLNTSAAGPAIVNRSITDILKPDVMALGENIVSAVYFNNNSIYFPASGTEVSAAVATGAVALLWSAIPNLRRDIEGTIELLKDTAMPIPVEVGECFSPEEYPNNVFGAGPIQLWDAYKSYTQPIQIPPSWCFSGETMVEVKGKGNVLMKDLQVGDAVTQVSGGHSMVYSFGHRLAAGTVTFLRVTTALEYDLEITADHLVRTIDKAGGMLKLVPASQLNVDDYLVAQDGSPMKIESIKTIKREGAFSPLTASGTLVISGVEVSSYVTRDWVNNVFSGESLHYLQHAGLLPYHVYCYMIGGCGQETYDDELGFNKWVLFWYNVEQWQVNANTVVRVSFWAVFAVIATLLIGLGKLMSAPVSVSVAHVAAVTLGYYVYCKNVEKPVEAKET